MTTSSCEADKYEKSSIDQNSNVQLKQPKIILNDPLEEWELTDAGDIEFNRIFEKMETLIAEWIQETSCRLSRVSVTTNDISNSDNDKLSRDSNASSERMKTPECLLYLGLASRDYDAEEEEEGYKPVKEIIIDGKDNRGSSGKRKRKCSIFDNRNRETKRGREKRLRRCDSEMGETKDEWKFTKPRVYECDCCLKIFFHKVVYRRHMIRHIDRHPRCEYCNEIFLSKIAKRYHRAQCRR